MRNVPIKACKPTLLGIPLDANSSYLRGAAGAPHLIREAFRCDSSNSCTESGIELDSESLLDAGDLVGAGIVEFNPKRDVSQPRAMVCATILKEILGKMIAG